jgi:hypothetical protein
VQVEGGVRYTDDEKQFSTMVPTPLSQLGPYWAFGYSTAEPLEDTQSWDDWTPRFITKWTPTDTALVFASYTAGFKSGGFGTFSLTDNPAGESPIGFVDLTRADGFLPDSVEPEEVDSYEIGYKDSLFDGGDNFDLVAYYYDYTDFQITVSTDTGASKIVNVGQIESWGLEGSVTAALGQYFTGFVSMGYLDSEATDIQEACGLEDPSGCEGSSIFWVAVHRGYHHPHADTDKDVHSPVTKSIWISFFGWTVNERAKDISVKYSIDLIRKPNHVWFNNHVFKILWLVPICVALIDWKLSLVGVCLATGLGLLQDNLVNIFGHKKGLIGYRNFDTRDNSNNNFILGYLGWGQGWHNNHHHSPRMFDFGSGMSGKWWEIDLCRVWLWFLGKPNPSSGL